MQGHVHCQGRAFVYTAARRCITALSEPIPRLDELVGRGSEARQVTAVKPPHCHFQPDSEDCN